jgi:hypothetical protein
MGSSPLQNLIQNTDKDHKAEKEKTSKQDHSVKEKKMSLVKSVRNQQASKPVVESNPTGHERKKATYYVRKDLIKGLKMLGAETEKDLSQLVEEAIEKLLREKSVRTM